MTSNTTSEHYDGLGCTSCKSEYMSSINTWGTSHTPNKFNPFVVTGTIPYGPRGGGGYVPSGYRIPEEQENFYASSSSSCTTYGNVTPANGITYGKHMTQTEKKESYCCGSNPYTHVERTWNAYRPYNS